MATETYAEVSARLAATFAELDAKQSKLEKAEAKLKLEQAEAKLKKSQTNQAFAKTLTKQEKSYLWNHVHRYAGVEGTTAQEQFARLIEYVLNFLNGDSEMEENITAKALKMY